MSPETKPSPVPQFSFCGYPISAMKDPDPTRREEWVPCSQLATPGHAYCVTHGFAPAPDEFANLTYRVTADDIVDRSKPLKTPKVLPLFVAMLWPACLWIFAFEHRDVPKIVSEFIGAASEAALWMVWIVATTLRDESKKEKP